jgi:hypothetical protein
MTMPFTSPAVEVSTFCPGGVAEGDDGWLDVLEVPLFPPPQATTEAASVIAPRVPKTARTRRALAQTFRKCIEFS